MNELPVVISFKIRLLSAKIKGYLLTYLFTINNITVSGDAILSAENSGKPLGGRAPPPRTPLGELTDLLQTLYSWWGGACRPSPRTPSPRTLPPLSAFGPDFRPFWPHWAVSPTVFISPPMLIRGLAKTLIDNFKYVKPCSVNYILFS